MNPRTCPLLTFLLGVAVLTACTGRGDEPAKAPDSATASSPGGGVQGPVAPEALPTSVGGRTSIGAYGCTSGLDSVHDNRAVG